MSTIAELHPTPPSRHRFHVLDALRGFAAIVVVLWHVPIFFVGGIHSANGPLAVDFFFCLSGFVVAFSYEERLKMGMKYPSFLIARLIRLYPMYIAGTALGFLGALSMIFYTKNFHVILKNLFFVASAIFFVPNLHPAHSGATFPLDSPAWSLFFELVANAGYALLVVFGLSSSWILGLIASISFGFLVEWQIRGGLLWQIGWQNLGSCFSYGFARVAVSFLIGILLLRIYRLSPYRMAAYRRSMPILITALLLMILTTHERSLQTQVFQLIAVVTLLPSIVYLGAICPCPHRWTRSCQFLGELSYPIYLLHMPFILFLESRFAQNWVIHHPASRFFVTPALLVTTVLLSTFLIERFDKPVRKYLAARFNTFSAKECNRA
jgi:peptidoglycan/LPS O-acetylase OafA/YrhL